VRTATGTLGQESGISRKQKLRLITFKLVQLLVTADEYGKFERVSLLRCLRAISHRMRIIVRTATGTLGHESVISRK
jgi:hypothetical protein